MVTVLIAWFVLGLIASFYTYKKAMAYATGWKRFWEACMSQDQNARWAKRQAAIAFIFPLYAISAWLGYEKI